MIFELTPTESINKTLSDMQYGDTLLLNDGIYHEKVEVWKNGITLRAKNPLKSIITSKDYYHKIMPDKNECNTFRTYTLYIGANDVILDGLIIRNESTPSSIFGQAVSLHVDGSNFLCKNCTIESAQDTLFTGPMPADLLDRYQGFYPSNKLKGTFTKQVYSNCKIIGDVDFIFGCATAYFENCEIITVNRNTSTPSYVCAPAHPKELPFGYLFYHCQFKGKEKTFLARPWRDYGCAAFIECELGEHILPEGYNKWNNTNRDQTARFYEYTNNKDVSQRVPWSHQFSSSEAEIYLKKFQKFIKTK